MGRNRITEAFDPLADLSPDDLAYLNRQKAAKARQMAAWKAGEGPEPDETGLLAVDDDGNPIELPEPPVPFAVDQGRIVAPGAVPVPVPLVLQVFRASPITDSKELPPAHMQHAPSWDTLKDRLKPHDGAWMVKRFELAPDVTQLLGFFGMNGWEEPQGAQRESFEVIVKGGRVFRTDPE